MKIQLCLALAVLVFATVQSYSIPPVGRLVPDGDEPFVDFEGAYDPVMRERRSPQGSIDFGAGYGPGGTGNFDAMYKHEIWRGRNGQSFELNGGYNGQYGGGRPNHNFGIGGTYRF